MKEQYKNIDAGTVGIEEDAQKKLFPELNTANILADAKKRNIFTFLPAEVQQASANETDVSKKISDLKLVGIIWSNNPQAMIENIKEQKTYLLGAGDNMSEIKVKRILKDKVVLDIEGKEWELR